MTTAPRLTSESPAIIQAVGGSNLAIHAALEEQWEQAGLGGEVLDFGAGAGWLTRRLMDSRRFTRVAAVDLLPRPQGMDAVEWRSEDLNQPTTFASSSFDTVVASEIIEHLENPRAFGREVFRLLRPGGAILLSTPNNESIRAFSTLLFKGHFAAFLDSSYPAHITALVRADLERVLTEVGFVQVRFSFTGHGGIPKFPSVTWQRVSRGLLRGMRFSDNVICMARKPVTSSGSAAA